MLSMRKLPKAGYYLGGAAALVALLYGCRANQSNLNENDPFATSDEEIANLQGGQQDFKSEFGIELITIKYNNGIPSTHSVLVTKDNPESTKALAAYLNPEGFEKVAQCRNTLVNNIQSQLATSTRTEDALGEDAEPLGLQAELDEANGKSKEKIDVKTEIAKVLSEVGASSVYFRLAILASQEWYKVNPAGQSILQNALPNKSTINLNCGILDMQLRWAFATESGERPKTTDGADWWDGMYRFKKVSQKEPVLPVAQFLKDFKVSKGIASRRISIENEAANNPLIENLR